MKRERKREVGRGEEGRWREEKRRGGSKGGKERTAGKERLEERERGRDGVWKRRRRKKDITFGMIFLL